MIAKANNTETKIEFRHVDCSGAWLEVSDPGFLPEYEYRIVEETYKVGETFAIDDYGLYMLSHVGSSEVCLISLSSGNLWSNKVKVKNIHKVTKKEMSTISNNGQVEKVSGSFVTI